MEERFFYFILNVFVIGLGFWIFKIYLDRLVKGNNCEMERITRKEANEMIEKAVEDLNEKIDKLYVMFEEMRKEITNIKLVLVKIETCLEKNGKIGAKS